MTLFLETGQYFGTSQNGIEDKKNGTEGVPFLVFLCFDLMHHSLPKKKFVYDVNCIYV